MEFQHIGVGGNDYLSRPAIAGGLERPTIFGLAPDRVFHAPMSPSEPVSSYLTLFTVAGFVPPGGINLRPYSLCDTIP